MSKNRAGAIITYDDGLIVIQRIKGNKENLQEYYVIPGGGQEDGETIEQAALREVKEELGIEIELTQNCYEIESQGKRQYFFVSRYKSGEIGTGAGEEMTNIDYEKHGAYIPKVIPKEDIKNINLLPIEIKDIILRDIEIIFGK